MNQPFARIRQICPGGKVTVGPWVSGKAEPLPREMLSGVEILYCELPPANFGDLERLKWIQPDLLRVHPGPGPAHNSREEFA